MLNVTELFASTGPLARYICGFAPRPEQQAMAQTVAQALKENRSLIVEAGTGIGKTYAYLVPALLSGKRVIISTGTRNLQDQLFHRDLPTVRNALGLSVKVGLLKGRGNYLCLHRFMRAQGEGRQRSRARADELERIRLFAGLTRSGDISEVSAIAEDSSLWPLVTSTTDNCLGQECPSFSECFVVRARRAAQEAQLLVVNHHLLFADMVLKGEGFGELLPGADAVILDEAHELPEVAANFFGLSLNSRAFLELARDTVAEQIQAAGDMAELSECAGRLEKCVHDMRLAFGVAARRAAWQAVAENAQVVQATEALSTTLTDLQSVLEGAAQRSKGLKNCLRRCGELSERLHMFRAAEAHEQVQWFETHTLSFTLHRTPLEVADSFRSHRDAHPGAWIFTSATLAVDDSFDHFAAQIGLADADTLRLDSPFDYAQNALLYIPSGLPEPNEHTYTHAVLEVARPVLEASHGRAFLLFTSHRALKEVAEALEGKIAYPLLIQGRAPRAGLLERFRALGNAVLLGTSSFWEGVDVRGRVLSCVIIDKLPFAAPGDPLIEARIDAIRKRGGNPFMEYQLPTAVIALKQGAGRLIRDINDRGVMVICDPRLYARPYGRLFLNSLPPMRRTRHLSDVQAFFAATG
jgi:Rad3-related DNA helicases